MKIYEGKLVAQGMRVGIVASRFNEFIVSKLLSGCEDALLRQLDAAGCPDRAKLPFQKAILDQQLPYTIGGGIGQSRLCMLLLGSAHIGEVQASVWDNATREACEKAGIPLL